MKNTFGQSISLTLFGESHGEAIGIVIDGLCPGLEVSEKSIKTQLDRRRPSTGLDTARHEADDYKIISGVFNGKTTGTPICIIIPNNDTKSSDYSYGIARPSHADYAAFCKYHGYEDYRGGGHFSGRITAALTAAGGIFLPVLEKLGITLGTHIRGCAGVSDRAFIDIENDIKMLKTSDFPVLDEAAGEKMKSLIIKAKQEGDSVGGVTQTAVSGLPAGLGEPFFDSVEGVLSHALFSIGGIKGVEFGGGFSMTDKRGSDCNDEFLIANGRVTTKTNNGGGVNGGITNGMPMIFQCAIKPTPSIAKEQQTVDFIKSEQASLQIRGRHDPAIIRRICPVIDCVTAAALCDMIALRYGTDAFLKDGIL